MVWKDCALVGVQSMVRVQEGNLVMQNLAEKTSITINRHFTIPDHWDMWVHVLGSDYSYQMSYISRVGFIKGKQEFIINIYILSYFHYNLLMQKWFLTPKNRDDPIRT